LKSDLDFNVVSLHENNNNNLNFLLAEKAKNIHHTTNKAIYRGEFGVQQPSLLSHLSSNM
jgi:hypothetical protein